MGRKEQGASPAKAWAGDEATAGSGKQEWSRKGGSRGQEAAHRARERVQRVRAELVSDLGGCGVYPGTDSEVDGNCLGEIPKVGTGD